jgi:hypothetical protein
MNRRISTLALVCLLFLSVGRVFGQLQNPVPPVNIIIDSDMAISVDDVGDHAVLWALQNRGEINVLAEVCSSANDFSAPAMHAIATYYGHPNILIGAHQGTTPNLENSATSNYNQQLVNQFGTPGDTRANYPDAVAVYRQALAGAPDHSVYIVSTGYFEALQGLLQSPADATSPLTGTQLVAQKVVRLVVGAGFFPSGNEHNIRVDADAAKFVYANWPVEIVNAGVEVSMNVVTGPSSTSNPAVDPVKFAYNTSNGGNPVPGFGQVPLLFAVRGLGTTFTVPGFNGQTQIEGFSEPTPGQDNWFSTPQVGHSYLALKDTVANVEATLNTLLQGSSNMPMLRSISPTSVPAGGSGPTVTLTGTNFFSDSQVTVNGTSRTTTFISATQLSVQLSSSDVAQAGQVAINVANSEGGGWTSNAINLAITGTGGTAPTLSAISPTSVLAGSGPAAITATGTNFASNSSVQVNGTNLATTFISSTQLSATISATSTATAGTLPIDVSTPGGGTSGTLIFNVNNPAPSLTSVSPTNVIAGSGDFTLTVNGSGFVVGSVVEVNGSSRTTTFVSATQLTAAIPAGDVASTGSLPITVVNAAPGGGSSSQLTVSVTNPAPSLANISPNTVTAGSAAFTLAVNGSNFVPGSVVQVNGSSRTTTFSSSTQLTASIPTSDVASAGNVSVTVFNPTPGGGTSAAVTLAVTNPQPSLTSMSPTSVQAGSGAFTLTLNGGNFIAGSVVRVNGSNRTTTFVSASRLTAQITAADVATAANLSITVFNPSPGGGTSAALTFTVLNPVPSISSISPATTVVLGPSFTLTVNGSGFVTGSVVQVDGSPRPTTFVSSTQLTAQISNNDILSLGQRTITVFNPAPGGGTSNSATLTVVGLLGQVTAPDPAQLAAAMDLRPEPFFSLTT